VSATPEERTRRRATVRDFQATNSRGEKIAVREGDYPGDAHTFGEGEGG
jgi:hypothetical protein